MEEEKKTGFSSKLGFILAAAGSAVGLGNIWRFPYLAAQYGGGIFLLVYIILAVTFGFALLVTEIAIGRKTGKGPIGAYKELNKKFSPLGWLAMAVPIVIFPYYCVIGGWVLKYLTMFIFGNGAETATSGYFANFIGNAGQPTLFLAIYIILTAVIVMLGVKKGIEQVSKIMMPILLVIIVVISIYSMTLDGAWAGVKYYFIPNFENFSFKTVIAAMGQLFYSMSIAMGIMITYGSYMRKEDNLEKSVRQIEIFDTVVAILSGLMIIPAVFAFSGGNPDTLNAGPGLMFITIPNVFNVMGGGQVMGTIFFILVALAALTSSISLMETIVKFLCDKFKLNRIVACLIIVAIGFIIGLLSVFGYSIWDNVLMFGKYQLLDFFDFISNNIMMPIVALVTCILIGYIVKTDTIEAEIKINGEFKSVKLYRVMIKFICPLCMVLIFLSSIFGWV